MIFARFFALTACCCLLLAVGAAPVLAQGGPSTDEEKTLYALGVLIAQNLAQFQLSEEELTAVQDGLADGVLGREPKVDLAQYAPKVQELGQTRAAAVAQKEADAAEGFLAEMGAQEGAVTTDSGLVYTEITPGDGPSPSASDRVTVHYHGTLRDGTVFDSSVDRGQPATFPLNGVIACWQEGVQRMNVGGRSRLVCPADLAYGPKGRPGIPGNAVLVFEVELLGIEDAEAGGGAPGQGS